jgi:hypothetical protein
MHAKSFAVAVFSAVLAISGFVAAPRTARADVVETIDHNTTIVVNGWKLKADTLVRRSDGIVKAVGNARASHGDYNCSGAADKIVLNTNSDKITFWGEPRVTLDGSTHVAHGSTGLAFDYRHHSINAVAP